MALDARERKQLHGLFYDLMSGVGKSPSLSDKDREYFINQIRNLETELLKDKPNPQMVKNCLEEFKKSLPNLEGQLRPIMGHPHVREVAKSVKQEDKWWKRFFG